MLVLSKKQKAFAMTTAIFAFAVVVGMAIQFIAENVPGYVILYIAGFAMFCVLFNLMYTIMIAKLEYDERFEKSVDK